VAVYWLRIKTTTKPEKNPMNTTKYIGINLHQATSVFAIRDHQGKLPGEAVLETKPAAIIDFLKAYGEKTQPNCKWLK